MPDGDIVWVRSLLAVYRQAAIDVAHESAPPAARRGLLEDLDRFHALLAAHERLDGLWGAGFGGTAGGMRAATESLIEAALLCHPASPMRALVGFAAAEIAALFEE